LGELESEPTRRHRPPTTIAMSSPRRSRTARRIVLRMRSSRFSARSGQALGNWERCAARAKRVLAWRRRCALVCA